MEKKGAIIKIYGKVQGVGFRYYTQQKAHELSIDGFVQNRPDGSVYVEAEGSEENLDAFILWCHDGPGWARVTNITVQRTPAFGYDEFTIK
ncbi:MAG: acylphosphatase [Bacteroidetes bacterium]|nr:MAG: acylphosphatase [Bacteroidota bacterium]